MQRLFARLLILTQQSELKISVKHSNLETVYLEVASENEVLVHDRGYVHDYLSTEGDSTYRDWSELGMNHIRSHCDRLQLSLENLLGDKNGPQYICGRAKSDSKVLELVDRVATCQDEIFRTAMRDPY